ncbi:MAG: large-conductance mechanosensitive channel protein MscL [Bacteroidaceae bacterium]|nr:large-conductance mechanosensitive channel protein MscL [Bacteroidaceae bacterium]
MANFVQEFKEFALKGNVFDMAVGVIVGGAFGKIVGSLVDNVIMPPIGVVLGGVDFSDLKCTLKDAVINEAGEVTSEAVTLNYGAFIQTCVDFLIVAFCVFLLVKLAMKLTKKQEEVPAEEPVAPEPTAEEKLLTEIRDLLKK